MRVARRERLAATLVATCLAASVSQVTHAVGIQFGDLNGSWDTTLAYGQSWRVANLDCRLIATADGGCGRSPNIDDGDLNYLGRAVFSKSLSAVTEICIRGPSTRPSSMARWMPRSAPPASRTVVMPQSSVAARFAAASKNW